MRVEWTGREQVYFFLQSMLVGACIGVLFDVFSGWGRLLHKKAKIFLVDILFAFLSAILTFCASLVIMDGQLHPLLLFGLMCGALAEHYSVGHFVSLCFSYIGKLLTRFKVKLIIVTKTYSSRCYSDNARFGAKFREKSKNNKKNTNLL